MSWTRNLLPRSLRSRLILSFGILIFLSLFLAGTTTVYLLRAEQERTARERVGRLAEPIALRAAILEASGANPTDIEAAMPVGLLDDYAFDFCVLNRGTATATLVTSVGVTAFGSLAVAAGTSGLFRLRKNGASVYILTRIA